jgi:hypothetical protein
MPTLCQSDHNRSTVVLTLHPLLLELHADIPVRTGPTAITSSQHRHPGVVMTCKSTAILDLEYQKRKFVSITGNDSGMLMDSKPLSTR